MIVLKCGGSTLDTLDESFYEELIQLKKDGYDPVIVHGGGPAISNLLTSLNIKPQFIDGLRVTDEETLKVVEMVLIGQTNKQIVKRLKGIGFGLSGLDGNLIEASQLKGPHGFVGQIEQVHPETIRIISRMGLIPVIAPLGVDNNGQSYNINADTAAGAIASALEASLIVITDVPGVMRDGVVLPELSVEEVNQLIKNGVITDGMIPKVQAALDALEAAKQVLIVDPAHFSQAIKQEVVGTKIIGKVN